MSIADIRAGDKVYVVDGDASGGFLSTGEIRTVNNVFDDLLTLRGPYFGQWNKDRFLRIPAVGDYVPKGSTMRQVRSGGLGECFRTTFDYDIKAGSIPRVLVSSPEDAKAAKIKELEETLEQAQAQLRELRDQ